MGISMKKSRKRGVSKNRRGKRKGRYTKYMRRNRKHSRKQTRKQRRRSRQSRRHVQRGGWNLGNIMAEFPFGQDIVNVGRAAETGLSNTSRGYRGIHKGVSQWPSQDQLQSSLGGNAKGAGKGNAPLDIAGLYKKNKATVKGIGPS
jgi:hypothetical protein